MMLQRVEQKLQWANLDTKILNYTIAFHSSIRIAAYETVSFLVHPYHSGQNVALIPGDTGDRMSERESNLQRKSTVLGLPFVPLEKEMTVEVQQYTLTKGGVTLHSLKFLMYSVPL